jgi:two-component system sensor histidine kinase KdpD
MNLHQKTQGNASQYVWSLLAVLVVAAASYPVADMIGYRTVSLILLLLVSILAMRFSIGPVTMAAILSALIWDFFFIPPHFTLTVGHAEDALMLLMYFIIALLNGILTHQMKIYDRIVRRREDKESTLRLYNTLFNSLSHELRTPIASILAASENLMARDQQWSEQDKRSMTMVIHEAGERLNRLVDNLLNASRLESGHLTLKWDWCDVRELINTALQRLKPATGNRTLDIQIPDHLPLLRLDFTLMEQAIFNLLHNAVTYTPQEATIEIKVDYKDHVLIIEISDNGPGFKEEDLRRIFDKFYRPQGSKAGGIGLGLSIVKGVIKAHLGLIEALNRPEGGAAFVINIPTGHISSHTHQH